MNELVYKAETDSQSYKQALAFQGIWEKGINSEYGIIR